MIQGKPELRLPAQRDTALDHTARWESAEKLAHVAGQTSRRCQPPQDDLLAGEDRPLSVLAGLRIVLLVNFKLRLRENDEPILADSRRRIQPLLRRSIHRHCLSRAIIPPDAQPRSKTCDRTDGRSRRRIAHGQTRSQASSVLERPRDGALLNGGEPLLQRSPRCPTLP